MVLEADIFFFFSTSVLNVENTDQISSPASQNTIKNLEYDAWKHAQLGERVRQSEQNLSNLFFDFRQNPSEQKNVQLSER